MAMRMQAALSTSTPPSSPAVIQGERLRKCIWFKHEYKFESSKKCKLTFSKYEQIFGDCKFLISYARICKHRIETHVKKLQMALKTL